MLRFLFTRLSLIVPTFLGVTLLTFAMIRLIPGDPILLMAGERGMDEARYNQLKAELGLDQPILVQYAHYLGDLAQGNFGKSIITRESVLTEFTERFPATVELAIAAITLAMLIGLPVGIIAAVNRNSAFDHVVMGASLIGYSMPIFWWGLLLILLFSGTLGWTPVSGRMALQHFVDPVTGFSLIDSALEGNWKAFRSALHHLVLPTIALATIPLAVIARMTRSSMLEVLNEDYIRTARAKGLQPWRVVGLHALRNALIPVITVIGLQVGTLLGGAILTETIFSWPGIGKWLIEAIRRRDYPEVQGGVLLVATIVMLVNLTVDVMYGLVNPRIRKGR